MSYSFLAYIVLSIFIWFTVVVRLVNMPRPVSAIVVAVMFFLILVFYSGRWFYGSTVRNNPNGTWPPIINMCPDYLVYYKWNGTDTCIDLSGVNRSNGTLIPWTQDDSFQNPPTNPAKYFPYIYKPGMTDSQVANLCTQANNNGVSWEGIADGNGGCTYFSSNAATGGINGGNCAPS